MMKGLSWEVAGSNPVTGSFESFSNSPHCCPNTKVLLHLYESYWKVKNIGVVTNAFNVENVNKNYWLHRKVKAVFKLYWNCSCVF